MATTVPPRLSFETGSPLCPQPNFLPSYGCPRSSTTLTWSKSSCRVHLAQAGMCAEVVVGNLAATKSNPLSTLSALPHGQFSAHTPQKQNLGFLQPSYQSPWSSNQSKGLVLVQDPRTGTPNLQLSLLTSHGGSLPMNSLPLSPLPWAQVPTLSLFFPSYQVTCGLFLIALVVQKCFCSSQLVFSGNVPHLDVFFIHSSSISSYSAILIDCSQYSFPQKCLKIAYILHISGLVYINHNHFVFFILSKKIIFNSKKNDNFKTNLVFDSTFFFLSFLWFLIIVILFLHELLSIPSFLYYGLATIVRVF